jgi:hypothetical protein
VAKSIAVLSAWPRLSSSALAIDDHRSVAMGAPCNKRKPFRSVSYESSLA